jgi:hypothetical protein
MHATVADSLLDCIQNAIEAQASGVIAELVEDGEFVRLDIADNGNGMDEETLRRCRDPFYTEPGKHANRKVCLGLPFLEQAACASGGSFDIGSEPGTGTSIRAVFNAQHPDLPPLGNLPVAVVSAMTFSPACDLVFKHRYGTHEYTVRSSELSEALGGLSDADSLILARTYIEEQEKELHLLKGAIDGKIDA